MACGSVDVRQIVGIFMYRNLKCKADRTTVKRYTVYFT